MDGSMTAAQETAAQETAAQDRLARARAALGRAERAVGVRSTFTVLSGGMDSVPSPASPSRQTGADGALGQADGSAWDGTTTSGTVAGGTGVAAAGPPPSLSAAGAQSLGDVLRVPQALAPLLPDGLARGSVVEVAGSTSLLLAMAGAACEGGAWCAMASVPDVGWQAAAAVGLPLDRVAVVPAPGPDAPLVLAALADGFDVLVVGRCPALTQRDQRSLTARLRSRGAVLLTAGPWPESHLRVDAHATALGGLRAGGGGYLRSVDLRVSVSGRLALRSGIEGHELDVRLGVGGVRAVAGDTARHGGTATPARARSAAAATEVAV